METLFLFSSPLFFLLFSWWPLHGKIELGGYAIPISLPPHVLALPHHWIVKVNKYESLEGWTNASITTVFIVSFTMRDMCARVYVFNSLLKLYLMYKCIQTITKSQWVRVREPLELLSAFVNEFWLNDAGDGVCTEAWTRDARCKAGDEEVGWEMKNRPAEGCDSEERVVRVGVNRWIMMIQFNQHLRWRANYVSKNCHIPSASHAK